VQEWDYLSSLMEMALALNRLPGDGSVGATMHW
jgi:hypothetical protein